MTDYNGIVTHYTYNAVGDVKVKTDAFGTSQASATTYEFNNRGLVRSIQDSLGNVTQYEYDAARMITLTTDPLGKTSQTRKRGREPFFGFTTPRDE